MENEKNLYNNWLDIKNSLNSKILFDLSSNIDIIENKLNKDILNKKRKKKLNSLID